MRPVENSTPPKFRFGAESALVTMAVLLLLLPWLFISSPDYRELGLLVFGIASACVAWSIPGLRTAAHDRLVRLTIICLIVVQVASLVGGLHHGNPVGMALLECVTGISGALGMGAITWVLLEPRWRPWAWRTFIAVTLMLVIGSLLGFLVFNRWQEDLSKLTPHMDTRRLGLVWATRFLSGELGRQFWAHANTAAFLFAAAWVVLVDALFRRPGHAWAGWTLALLLALAVFLTASRSAWVMVILALPPLLVFRGWRYSIQVGALLVLSGILGIAAMKETAKPPTQPGEAPAEIHLGRLVERGSSGRLSAYQVLWNDLEGDRLFGQGLAVTRQPVVHLLHEHSTYLATLRGGGMIALAAHLVLIGCASWAAVRLARRGCRWPLLLTIAVFSGLLFDRSTVFRLSGFEEFPTHWFAVWIPLALLIRPQPRIASCRPIRPDTAD